MKTLRQTCAVAILTLLLSAAAFAGQVNCPGVASTPPPTEPTTSETTSVVTVIEALVNKIISIIN